MRFRLIRVLLLCGCWLCGASFARAQPAPPQPAPPQPAPPFDLPPALQSTPSLDAARARLQALRNQLATGAIPVDPQNLALLRLKLEQCELYLARLPDELWPDETRRLLSETLDRAREIGQTRGDAAFSASRVHERAYIALADGSTQPYWVYLPPEYSPRRRYPLVIFLHGYDPAISKIAPWLPDESMQRLAAARGFILAVPYGRRNSDFVNIGEDDTLAVTDEVLAHYSADPQRVFLLGVSMGGYGAYTVGLHHPQRWAGVAVLCGRTDFYLWFQLERAALPAWKRILYDADDPRHLARNASHLPFFIQHGTLDSIVPVEHSRRFVADLKRLGGIVRYREIPDGDHFIYQREDTLAGALDWMKTLSRTAPPRTAPPRHAPPRHVTYATGTLRDNRAHWITVDALHRYDKLAALSAEIRAHNVIEVKVKNVDAFTLEPPTEYLEANRSLTLKVNGRKVGVLPPGAALRWRSAPEAAALCKTPARSGPIKNCYRDPFLVVYGTLRASDDEANARRFVQEWSLFADGVPPLKADSQVTADDFARYNLVLFGTRETNLLLAEVADQLPLELLPDGYRLGARKVATSAARGAQLCYPSPWSEKRMIVVQSGLFWGAALPINHKFDLLPEYIVYSGDTEDSGANRALVAGFFDHAWRLP